MMSANLVCALGISLGLKITLFLSGFSLLECLVAYAICGTISMLGFSWAVLARVPARTDQGS